MPGQSSPALQGATSEKEQTYWGKDTQVSATVRRSDDDVTLRVDYQAAEGDDETPGALRKSVRVNDAPRRATDLVGQMTAVMFAAVDLELVYGPPSARRRYLDILISQLDREYLRTAQRYQRVAYQRNHLLRAIRDRRADPAELAFWDDRIVHEGAYLVAARSRVVSDLSGLTGPVHEELTDTSERLAIDYLPSFDLPRDCDRAAAAAAFRHSLDAARDRELARGATLSGPHRDDLRIEIDGMPAGPFASRGQARTAVLSMRLAEAKLIEQRRGDGPVILLDDVLSELDEARREKILRRAREYDQCLITTPEIHPSDESLLAGAARFTLEDNTITPA